MDRLQIDLKEFTFYEEFNDGYTYMLTAVDHFSGYPWAFPLFSKTAEEVAFHLVNLFFQFGPPRCVDVYQLFSSIFSNLLEFYIQIMVESLLTS